MYTCNIYTVEYIDCLVYVYDCTRIHVYLIWMTVLCGFTQESHANRDTAEMGQVCCSVLQCVAVCCSVLQCVAGCCSALQCVAVRCSVLQCVAVCCSVLQCVAVCCSVLQCVAVCCSVLQCVAVCCRDGSRHHTRTH